MMESIIPPWDYLCISFTFLPFTMSAYLFFTTYLLLLLELGYFFHLSHCGIKKYTYLCTRKRERCYSSVGRAKD